MTQKLVATGAEIHRSPGYRIGVLPAFGLNTAQEHIQNLPEYFEKYRDEEFEVTVKLDGVLHTVAWYNDEFYVCGRKTRLKYDHDQPQGDFCQVVKRMGFYEKLRNFGREIVLQGEFVGPGIKNNRAKYQEKSFLIFDIFDHEKLTYLTASDRSNLLHELFGEEIPHVPRVESGFKIFRHYADCDSLLKFADMITMNASPAEGIVCQMISDPRISFKVISYKYLLEHRL